MKNIELLIIRSVGNSFHRTRDRLEMAIINGRMSAIMRQQGQAQGGIGEFPTCEAARTLRNQQRRKGRIKVGLRVLFIGKVVRVVKGL